jgi:hypothetical protein
MTVGNIYLLLLALGLAFLAMAGVPLNPPANRVCAIGAVVCFLVDFVLVIVGMAGLG